MKKIKSSDPVFIIGCPRTGSKIYLNAISNNSDVNISPELHILNPRWLHPDFRRIVDKKIGLSNVEDKKKKFFRLIEEGVFLVHFGRETG